MKSTMTVAALALAASIGGASAGTKTVTYAFVGYCDGVAATETLDAKTNGLVGTDLQSWCGGSDYPVGGFHGGLNGTAKGLWSMSSYIGSFFTVIYLDEKALTMTVYAMSPTLPWSQVATSTLIPVDTAARHGKGQDKGKSLLETVKAALANAKTAPAPKTGVVDYTFADGSGTPLCDGLSLTETAIDQNGTHTGCTQNDIAGGPRGYVQVVADHESRTVYTADALNHPGLEVVYVIDDQAMTWSSYGVAFDGSVTWQQMSGGVLLKGAPVQGITKRSSLSGVRLRKG